MPAIPSVTSSSNNSSEVGTQMKKLRHSGGQGGESRRSGARTTVQWLPRACPGTARGLVLTEGPAAPPAAQSFASADPRHPGSPSAPRSLGLTEPPQQPPPSHLVIWQGSFLTLLRNVSAVPRCRGSGRSRATPLREWPPRDPLLRKGKRKGTG